MADNEPNRELEQKRLQLEINQLKLNIESQEYRILQIEDEKQRLLNNIKATRETIKEMSNNVKGVKE